MLLAQFKESVVQNRRLSFFRGHNKSGKKRKRETRAELYLFWDILVSRTLVSYLPTHIS